MQLFVEKNTGIRRVSGVGLGFMFFVILPIDACFGDNFRNTCTGPRWKC